jgi:hypothetical protein
MDNDILIDQARQLCAALHARQTRLFAANNRTLDRLESLLSSAYSRYQRRLNRCVLCYQTRKHDCVRDAGRKPIPCQRRKPFASIAAV